MSVVPDDSGTFVVDPLGDVGSYPGGTAVMIGGQLYTALPGVAHLLMSSDSVVVEPSPAGLLHHTAGALQPDGERRLGGGEWWRLNAKSWWEVFVLG